MITHTELNRLITEQNESPVRFSDREMCLMDIAISARREAERLEQVITQIKKETEASENINT